MGADAEASDPAVGARGGSIPITVYVWCSNGSKFSLQTALNSIVVSFKALVAEKSDVPAEQQRLIYKGRVLKDEQTLEGYDELRLVLFDES